MEMARPGDLDIIARYLVHESCSLSFSSLRADALGPTLLGLLGDSKLKSAAIAPDGASERLRRVINKGIVEDDLLSAAEALVKAGIRNLKLYFMIGLPTETIDDLREMVDLVSKIRSKILAWGRTQGKLCEMTLSINSFVPKPWTPFQFHPFEKTSSLKTKLSFIRKELGHLPNLKITAERPEITLQQAVLARGDRRTGTVLYSMVETQLPWKKAFSIAGINPDIMASRFRSRDEIFPWDIIDHGISRDFLWSEYQKALDGKVSSPCNTDKCTRCGVCNGQ